MWQMRNISFALLASGLALAGCETNPATGERNFSLMSPKQERAIGAQEHPKILRAYGGAYDSAQLGGYVAQVGGTIASNSDMAGSGFRFTLLNSPIVNAFALPGGYVYISRGLMALANSEAELAGVLGHEVGHVTARHSAQRYSRAQVAGLGGLILGAVLDAPLANDLINLGGGLYLSKYSRDQEFQSDQIGVKYMSKAGYDPYDMGDFLASMGAQSALHAKIEGRKSDPNKVEYFSTHPNTADRVSRAHGYAANTGYSRGERPDRASTYLKMIDGMIYGDDPAQGFVRDRNFDHPEMRVHFTAPEGFRLVNQADGVYGQGPDGSVLKFDTASDFSNTKSVSRYLSETWAASLKVKVTNVQTGTVNGMSMATATQRISTKSGPTDLRLVVYQSAPDQVFRFMVMTKPEATSKLTPGIKGMINSFRKISASEAAKLKPLRIRVVRVQRGQTVSGIAKRMVFSDYKEERFRVLNGLSSREGLRAGQMVKIITE